MTNELLQPLETPAIVLLLGAVATALAVLVIAPLVQLIVAHRQIKLGNRQADLTERHLVLVERQAAGGETTAQASLISAQNVGKHAVAQFRQQWVNALRRDLSALHALLMTMRHDGLTSERSEKAAALKTQIELMLNPEEKASDDLLDSIDALIPPVTGEAQELDALFVARSQVILKAEWDRLKSELQADISLSVSSSR